MDKLYSLPTLSVITSLFISQIFFTLPVFAAGYQLYEQSPSLEGNATAGAAAANNDVTAMFYNPANLSTLRENQAYLGGIEILPEITISQASATHTVNVPGIPPSSITASVMGQNYQGNISKGAFIPDAYLSWRINNKLVAGLAMVAPFGLTTDYYRGSVLRFAAQYSSIKALDFVPSLSFDITNQWAVGAGFQVQYVKAIFSNFDGPYTGVRAIDAIIAANYPTYLKGSSWGYGYTIGTLFKPDLCTRIGLAYRSSISEQIGGSGQQYTLPGGTAPAPSPDFLFNAQTAVHASLKTPAVLTLSAERDIDDWTVKASAQINFWNNFTQLSIYMPDAFATNSTIITKWKNAWFSALGADYRATPCWTLRAGVAYDQTPTTGYRDPRIPDSDRFWGSMGASYKLNKNLSFDGAYTHIFFSNQTVNVKQASGTNAITTVPLEVNQIYAKYKGHADILALGIRLSF